MRFSVTFAGRQVTTLVALSASTLAKQLLRAEDVFSLGLPLTLSSSVADLVAWVKDRKVDNHHCFMSFFKTVVAGNGPNISAFGLLLTPTLFRGWKSDPLY